MTNNIGVAISTHNRRDIYNTTHNHWMAHTDGPVTVIDDASDIPCPHATIRHNTRQGIAKTKNAGITTLMALGVEHLFLTDDDCYPTHSGWADLYINCGEPHAMYLFKDPLPNGQRLPTPNTIHDDGTIYAYNKPRGCLLYLHRSVVERIGGMRTDFGRWGHEHVEYSLRAYHAGLTRYPFIDACGSHNFIRSMDEHCYTHALERSVPHDERNPAVLQRNDEILNNYIGSTDYVEYRDQPDLAITCLLTRNGDPQRGGQRMQPNPELAGKWLASLQNCTPIILHDQLEETDPPYIKIATGQHNPYLDRWHHYYTYLRTHPARWVWLTDATDVEMLHTPWEHMQPDILYVGYEPKILADPWMRNNHPPYEQFIDNNPDHTLLNAGLVGGDHKTVQAFCHAMIREIDWRRCQDVGIGDMAAFNYVCHQPEWQHRIQYGPRWMTLFKQNERNNHSCWKHK